MAKPERNPSRKRSRTLEVRRADAQHQVVTVQGASSARGRYRKAPCSDCPWRVDATGVFPAEAFRLSARTAYDMAEHVFSCHQSGTRRPAVCAGFLLRGADHNLAVRLGYLRGCFTDVPEPAVLLHESYRAMAEANGVSTDDPVLGPCR